MTTRRTATLIAAALGTAALVGCAAPAAPVPTVNLGSATTSSSPGPLPSAAPALSDGEFDVAAAEAATARFAVSGGTLQLLSVQVADGWEQTGERIAPDEVQLRFAGGGRTVTLEAEVDDGRFETDVDIDEAATPGPRTYDAAGVGTVEVDVQGDRVALVRQSAAPGWVATVDEDDLADGEVEVRFRNDAESRTVDVEVDVDDGVLNVDIDTRTGRGYDAPRPR